MTCPRPSGTTKFLSTPSARRATDHPGLLSRGVDISIHALREEGDLDVRGALAEYIKFLSTPSARRATWPLSMLHPGTDFYPRPPRGGRPAGGIITDKRVEFLSTPSARRATMARARMHSTSWNFYPRPPRGGRLCTYQTPIRNKEISIHALREEGDLQCF